MLKESSLWLCIDQHTGLIGTNANNRDVMDNDWTASSQPRGISLHACSLVQTLYQCLRTPCQFECDGGTQWTWHWRRRPIGSHGSMTHYGGGYKLCFLRLIQHRPLRRTNWSANVSFLLHLFCLFLSCCWNEPALDRSSVSVWSSQTS